MKIVASDIEVLFDIQNQIKVILTVPGNIKSINPQLNEAKSILGKNKRLSVEIKQYREKRSLDANGYLWVMCHNIAEVIRSTKEEVYKKAIREVGVFDPLAILEDAVENFIKIWNERGLGWYAEVVDGCKIPGCKKVLAYYGSSCYNTKQMAFLIDYIVSECKELGIETMTENELESMKNEWGR